MYARKLNRYMMPSWQAPTSMYNRITFGLMLRQRRKGRNTAAARPIRISTENQLSTWPARYSPIRLKENAHRMVVITRSSTMGSP
ncbi:hypothetical protein D3C78_1482450 [compost metagenome]